MGTFNPLNTSNNMRTCLHDFFKYILNQILKNCILDYVRSQNANIIIVESISRTRRVKACIICLILVFDILYSLYV